MSPSASASAGGIRNVILVPGLWAPAIVMAPLAARLAARGFRCRIFRYAGRGRALEANAERLRRLARETGIAHYVGHSLGGLVIVQALGEDTQLAIGNTVLLGAPVSGSLAGRRLARYRLGRWLLGRSEPVWQPARALRWARSEALGVIAGSQPLGMGRAFGRLPGPNDGVVCLEETAIAGMRERVLLPVSHSLMIVAARTAQEVGAFLRYGRFRHETR